MFPALVTFHSALKVKQKLIQSPLTLHAAYKAFPLSPLKQDTIQIRFGGSVNIIEGADKIPPDAIEQLKFIQAHPADSRYIIGSGVQGKVYLLHTRQGNLVAKSPFPSAELKAAKELPSGFKYSPQYIGLVQVGSTPYLVMNFIPGSNPGVTNPLRNHHLEQLCDAMAELDEAGILHRNISLFNLMSDESNIKLIDYGQANFFEPLNFAKNIEMRFPTFYMAGNLQNFEAEGLSEYMLELAKHPDAESPSAFLDRFFVARAGYHRKREQFIANAIQQRNLPSHISTELYETALKFEELQIRLLTSPHIDREKLKRVELAKIQIAFTEAKGFDLRNKGRMLSSIAARLLAMQDARKLMEMTTEVKATLGQTETDRDFKEYLDYLHQYGRLWLSSGIEPYVRQDFEKVLNLFKSPDTDTKPRLERLTQHETELTPRLAMLL